MAQMIHAAFTARQAQLDWLRDQAALRQVTMSALVRVLLQAAEAELAEGREPRGWPPAVWVRARDEDVHPARGSKLIGVKQEDRHGR